MLTLTNNINMRAFGNKNSLFDLKSNEELLGRASTYLKCNHPYCVCISCAMACNVLFLKFMLYNVAETKHGNNNPKICRPKTIHYLLEKL